MLPNSARVTRRTKGPLGHRGIVRIPVKAASSSGSIRPVVPVQIGQGVRSISATVLGVMVRAWDR